MERQTPTLLVIAGFALLGGALLCGLMCLASYHH
jgi:hypothetical protein